MFQVIITNEVPVMIVYAYISLLTHFKDLLIRRILRHIYAKQLVAANFAKNRKNGERELSLIVTIPFFITVCGFVVT